MPGGVGDLRGELGFFFTSTAGEFATDFRVNADALACMARELADWLREQLRQHDCISVLGI